MANLSALFKDTAIYGLSSIVGRFLNYLLVPIYTRVLDPGEYGIVTNLYGYTALILVVLTFGMETSFFRFANKENEQPDTVFTTCLSFVATLTFIFLALIWLFITPIGDTLHYADHQSYIKLMAVVSSIDVLQAIPFCYLRFHKKSLKFAALKFLFILLNVSLNVIYFVVLGIRDVANVFILNLVCSGIVTFFFIPELRQMKWSFDFKLLRRLLQYSWPLFVLGIAGILNQTADKIIYPLVSSGAEGNAQLGIYGGCVKIAMIMAMITQAFRYAYEPIVFATNSGKGSEGDKKSYYAIAMKYFISFTLLAFLAVIAYLDLIKLLIGSNFREGIRVVPIVMAAEIMMGIFFNLSFWYKLIDKTIWGAWFSIAGCVVLIAVNVIFIPTYGYMACAWGGFAGYATCMILSYFVGQIKNPINYDLKAIFTYVALALVLYFAMVYNPCSGILGMLINTLLLLIYAAFLCYKDLPVGKILARIKKK